jgi:hypothetical protein
VQLPAFDPEEGGLIAAAVPRDTIINILEFVHGTAPGLLNVPPAGGADGFQYQSNRPGCVPVPKSVFGAVHPGIFHAAAFFKGVISGCLKPGRKPEIFQTVAAPEGVRFNPVNPLSGQDLFQVLAHGKGFSCVCDRCFLFPVIMGNRGRNETFQI